MQYVVRDTNDRELGRANDARSAWDLIEAEWQDAVAFTLDGTRARGWMPMAALLQEEGEVVILEYERMVGGVEIDATGR